MLCKWVIDLRTEALVYYTSVRVNLVVKRLMVKLLRAGGGCLGTRRR